MKHDTSSNELRNRQLSNKTTFAVSRETSLPTFTLLNGNTSLTQKNKKEKTRHFSDSDRVYFVDTSNGTKWGGNKGKKVMGQLSDATSSQFPPPNPTELKPGGGRKGRGQAHSNAMIFVRVIILFILIEY